jgi:hypothetical protein
VKLVVRPTKTEGGVAEYLVGISFRVPKSLDWSRGLIPDPELVATLYIEAESREAALAWGEQVGRALTREANAGEPPGGQSHGCRSWLYADYPGGDESFRGDRESIQHVSDGEWPVLARLKPEVYAPRGNSFPNPFERGGDDEAEPGAPPDRGDIS